MKLDINTIMMIALIVLCVFFGSMWFLQGSGYKKKIKESQKRIEQIEKVRDSLKLVNVQLEKRFDGLQNQIKERDKKIKQVEKELLASKLALKLAQEELERNKKTYDESKKRIKKLRENPVKREGDQLIESLKDKLNKN